ncbi:MAG: substrate-binding domain-containing protein [Actinomycetota bacterium]|nr:substrate-binding domain-containing protein [Actinomycetota bacterium]
MNVIEGRPRAAGRRSALFACALALLAALGALQASGASALGEQCSGSNVKGMGSFLQAYAQQRWSQGEDGFNSSSSSPLACNGSQGSGGTPEVSYVPLGSPAALRHWGAEDGAVHSEPFGFLANFIGTDIAPSGPVGEEGTMLANMKAALGSDLAVVPVTQTAIAIAAHPPALPAHQPCVVPQINNAQLEKVFSGEIKNWRKLNAASDPTLGGDCDQAITRIVREESAGTTYQFKHYLNSIDSSPLACTGNAKRTWAQLKAPFGGEAPPNLEWPRKADCQEGEGTVTTVAGSVGEGEIGPLNYVAANPGTITYGSLAEARQRAPKQIISVFNGKRAASPETSEGGANCGAAKYTLPAGWEAGVNVDWSQVYGSDPNIGEVAKNAYPICTLTWDVAAVDHFGEKAATTVRDYLAYVIDKEGGQRAVRQEGYADLPGPVAEAAAAAISQISGKEEEGEEEEGGEGTVLCKAEPELVGGVLTCPKGQGFSGIKVTGAVMPETVATFTSTGGPKLSVVCPQGEYWGEFNEDGTSSGNGISSLQFGFGEGCTTTFPEEPEAVVWFENPPYDASRFEYTQPLAPQGSFELAKLNKGPPLLVIQSTAICVYSAIHLIANVTNGNPTEIGMGGKWQIAEEAPEGACPTSLTHSARMSLTSVAEGKSLYIAGK